MAQAALKTVSASPYGSTGAGHPAIVKALQVYGKDWGEHSEHEQAFLKALRAADVKMIAGIERGGQKWGFGSGMWNVIKNHAARQRDADYASALAAFEASVARQFELEGV